MNLLVVHPNDILCTPTTVRILEFAKYFSQQGNQVKLVYFVEKDRRDSQQFTMASEPTAFQCFALNPYSLANNMRLMAKMARWCDIIHLQKAIPYSALPTLFGKLTRHKPLHYDWDDNEVHIAQAIHRSSLYPRLIRRFETNVPKFATTASYSSQAIRSDLKKMGFVDTQLFSAPVGVDLDEFNPNVSGNDIRALHGIGQNQLVVGFVGHLEGGSYADLIVSAASHLQRQGKQVPKFLIVGSGIFMNSLKSMAAEMNVDDHIIFVGSVPRGTIPNYIASFDIAVAPFRKDNVSVAKSPLKIVEYLGSGKPIIASDVGEVRQMLDDSGLTVQAGCEKSLAEAINSLQSDEHLRNKMAAMARKRAEQGFSWERSAANIMQAYDYALDRAGH